MTKTDTWISEFDDLCPSGDKYDGGLPIANKRNLKSFISQLIADTRKRTIEEIEGYILTRDTWIRKGDGKKMYTIDREYLKKLKEKKA